MRAMRAENERAGDHRGGHVGRDVTVWWLETLEVGHRGTPTKRLVGARSTDSTSRSGGTLSGHRSASRPLWSFDGVYGIGLRGSDRHLVGGDASTNHAPFTHFAVSEDASRNRR